MVSFASRKCGSTGNMFQLTDGKEHGLLKELMTAMEMKAGQELGIELKAQESWSLVVMMHFLD